MARSASAALEAGPSDKRPNASAELLLDATASLLAERSALDVSLSDIAKRSGLNSALIKYYFGNKDGLLLAVLERDAKVAMAALEHLVGMTMPAEKKLRIHISGIIGAHFRSPYLNRLIHFMVEHGTTSSSQRVVTIFVEPMMAAYRSIVAQGVAEGVFRPVDASLLYHSLVGACDHIFNASYAVLSTLGESRISEDVKQRYVAHISEIFLRGLAV